MIADSRKNFRKLNKLNLKRIESFGYFAQMQDKAAAAIRSSRQKLQPLKLDPLRHSDCKIAKKKIITVSPPEQSLVSELSERLQFRKMPALKKSLTLQRAKKGLI